MIRKKKIALLSAAALLGAFSVGTIAMANNGDPIGIFTETNEDAVVWKHYAAVAPTFTSYGSKEFWASCSNPGTHVFTKPSKGSIEEGDDFSKTAYFSELTETDDRYVAKLIPSVSFDTRGGVAIATQEVAYDTEVSSLPTTTRAGDDYYESYEFGDWYSEGTPLASDAKIQSNLNLKAGWKYGTAKKTYVSDVWNSEGFTAGSGVTIKTASSASGFDKTDDEGIMFSPSSSEAGVMTAPAINFSELLETKRAIYMEVGCYNSNNKLSVTASETKQITSNGGDQQDVKYLTRVLLRFIKSADGKVHMLFTDTTLENPLNYDGRTNRTGDLTLTDEQANGTNGLIFSATQTGNTRLHWLGRPYYINGQEKLLDVTQKTKLTVTGGALKNKSEVSGDVPWNNWYEYMGNTNEFVGIRGTNASGGSVLSFDAFDFNTRFENGQGVKFNIGAWNGGEEIYFNGNSLGANGAKPANVETHTADSVEKTWHNWEITVDSIGLHVYNKNEDKTYDFALSDAQLSGEDNLSLTLAKISNDRFFLLSNLYTFHM